MYTNPLYSIQSNAKPMVSSRQPQHMVYDYPNTIVHDPQSHLVVPQVMAARHHSLDGNTGRLGNTENQISASLICNTDPGISSI